MRYGLEDMLAIAAMFLIGLVFGSFAALASYRLPRRERMVVGRSRCPFCSRTLTAQDLIPLLSWLFQGGKCRHCTKPISMRYPFIELMTGSAFIAAFLYAGYSLQTMILCLLATCLIIMAVIALEHIVLQNRMKAALLLMSSAMLASCDIPSAPQGIANGARDVWQAPQKHMGSGYDITEQDMIDPNKKLTRQDYKNTFYAPPVPDIKPPPKGLMLPDVSQLMAKPKIPIVGSDKLVTISVTGDVPLKEVLMELARRADIDIEIDSGVEGGVIFRTKERPFSEVIERISDLAGLRYSVKDGVLRVERDTPYIENYNVDFLNVTRTSSSAVNITSTLLGGTGGSDGGSNISSGSQSTLNASSGVGDMWGIVEQGIFNILQNYRAFVEPLEAEEAAEGAPSANEGGNTLAEAVSGADVAKTADKAKPIIQKADKSSILSMNRQAGVIAVLGTKKQHDAIRKYLDQVSRTQSAQVLIEAKIVEVSLDDQYRSGIDWSFINGRVTPLSARATFTDTGTPTSTDLFSVIFDPAEVLGIDDTSLEATLQLVEQFGTGRTISSPRINTMNNQFAVLTFAENFVYFQLTVQQEEQQTDSTSTDKTLTVQSEIKTVPIGVILSLQPSIDLEKGEITMNLRPTLSRITGSVADPGVSIIAQQAGVSNITSTVPIVEVREMDSVLKMKSGQVMVIGGLMQEKSNNTDRGIPGVSGIPVIGKAFKTSQKVNEVVETVIFIKATIVPSSHNVSPEDKEFYRKFGRTRSSANL